MSAKRTFIYRMEMGQYPDVAEIAFCYARNSDIATENMKIIFMDRRYNMFKAYKLGETDYKKHPGPFEVVPKDEEEYLRKIRSTVGEEYAERRHNIPRVYEDTGDIGECGDALQSDSEESVSIEGESVSDSDE